MATLLAAHLDQLVCPVCHGKLALTPSTVDCTACARRYPIVEGLPVLIASRALANAEAPPADPESASKSI
jgi:uncharacterized protein YbaR (Trm112 family)